jgi:GMP synthase (glutamine-hydrolysing)
MGFLGANWRAIIKKACCGPDAAATLCENPAPMKPIFILQHLNGDGPAYLQTWLEDKGMPFQVFNIQAGRAFPATLQGCGGLAILGGEMSANDPLPSLRQAEQLFLQAVQQGVPTLGHCLGGQLMARALGARVVPSPAPEVGWQSLQVLPCVSARAWLQPFEIESRPMVFHWHREAFELPAGAEALATTAACPVQAFALGPHLAMQWHVELDEAKLHRWSLENGVEHQRCLRDHPGTVQSGAAMRAAARLHLAQQQALARHIYSRWLGLMGQV